MCELFEGRFFLNTNRALRFRGSSILCAQKTTLKTNSRPLLKACVAIVSAARPPWRCRESLHTDTAKLMEQMKLHHRATGRANESTERREGEPRRSTVLRRNMSSSKISLNLNECPKLPKPSLSNPKSRIPRLLTLKPLSPRGPTNFPSTNSPRNSQLLPKTRSPSQTPKQAPGLARPFFVVLCFCENDEDDFSHDDVGDDAVLGRLIATDHGGFICIRPRQSREFEQDFAKSITGGWSGINTWKL